MSRHGSFDGDGFPGRTRERGSSSSTHYPAPASVIITSTAVRQVVAPQRSVDDAVRQVEHSRLLNKKMFRELFKDADILTERFLGLPKSFIALRN